MNMKFPDIDGFKMDDEYFEEILPAIWLMDDHRWAYYIWEKVNFEHRNTGPFALVHLGCRWGGANGFHGDPLTVKRLVGIRDAESIYALVRENMNVRKDSFIAPAIMRGLVDEVYFYCRQTCTGPGLYPPFLKEYKAKQFIHEEIESLLSRQISKPVIFDLDLDLFNNSDVWDEGNLWADAEIANFLSMCSNLVRSSSVVTVAMSFGYSGTEQDTRHLTRLFTSFARKLQGRI